jgi:alanine racemase
MELMEGIKIIIQLKALENNFSEISRFISGKAGIMAVVKSDAYGHGLVPVARKLVDLGAKWLGAANLEEGIRLRRAGIQVPILILLGFLHREIRRVISFGLTPLIYDLEPARALGAEALRQGVKVRVHLKVDTGMGRLGVPYDQAGEFLSQLKKIKGIVLEGLCSHFSRADCRDAVYCRQQMDRFGQVLKAARDLGLNPPIGHLANSAGILECPQAHLSLVRPGLLLYGAYPSLQVAPRLALEPVMTVKSQVIQIRKFPEGTPLGYGGTYVTPRDSVMAVIPAGYADGLSRAFSNRGSVLIRGREVPLVGRVSMNLTLADITDLEKVVTGEEVVLLGRQKEAVLRAEDLAGRIGTIPYEIFCQLGKGGRHSYRK